MFDLDVRQRLTELADPKLRDFSARLTPTSTKIMGVKVPDIRMLAREIVRGDWQEYLCRASEEYLEERMLKGIVITYAKTDFEQKLSLMRDFLPLIDNWAVCDSVVLGFKDVKKHLSRTYEFLTPYFSATDEFSLRFAVVMLLSYFVTDDYVDTVLHVCNHIRHDGYYAKMAVAWALSVCFIKYRDKTLALFYNNRLDDFTFNKALQKSIESYRVTPQDKTLLRGIKRK